MPTPDFLCVGCPLDRYDKSPVVEVSERDVRRSLFSLLVLTMIAIFAGVAMSRTLRYACLLLDLDGNDGGRALDLHNRKKNTRIKNIKEQIKNKTLKMKQSS